MAIDIKHLKFLQWFLQEEALVKAEVEEKYAEAKKALDEEISKLEGKDAPTTTENTTETQTSTPDVSPTEPSQAN